jgi:RNA recognition motif-containing protein
VGTHLYVGNLGHSASVEAVAALFGPFGRVVNVVIPLGRDTGAARGFAYVTMSSAEQAAAAAKAVRGALLEGRIVTVQEAEVYPLRAPGPFEPA